MDYRRRRHNFFRCCVFGASVALYGVVFAAPAQPSAKAVKETPTTATPTATPTNTTATTVFNQELRLIVESPPDDNEANREADIGALRGLFAWLPRDARAELWQIAMPAKDQGNNIYPSLLTALEKITTEWRTSNNIRKVVIIIGNHAASKEATLIEQDKARRRVLTELLPRLQQAGITIFTYANSAHADNTLLSQLAVATNGWFLPYRSTDALWRMTLHSLEAINKRDFLPIEDSLVRMDDSVEEASLLLFRKDPNLPPRLIPPMRMAFSQFNAPADIKWQQEQGFDVITLTKPLRGTWQIESEADRDDRMIGSKSSLSLAVTPLANNLLLQQPQLIKIELQKNGVRVVDRNVLDHVALKVSHFIAGREARLWYPTDDGQDADAQAEDGVYTIMLNDSIAVGANELVVDIEGLNFRRRNRQVFMVHDNPAWAELKASGDGRYVLSVMPRFGMLDPTTMSVTAHVKSKTANEVEIPVPRYTTTEWRTEFTAGMQDLVDVNVRGSTEPDKPISIWLRTIAIATLSAPSMGSHESAHGGDMHTTPQEHSMESKQAAPETHSEAQATEQATNASSWSSLAKLIVGNIVLLLMAASGIGLLRFLDKRWAKQLAATLAHD